MTAPQAGAWDSRDADPIRDMRNAVARLRAQADEPYRPPVYYLPVWAYDRGVLEGLISLEDPTWRPYP